MEDNSISKKWFVAIVTPNTERACAARLITIHPNVEAYVPVQVEMRRWQSKKSLQQVERVLCPCYLFVRCTERERKDIKSDKACSFILHFMKDRSRCDSFGNSMFAEVPDRQMLAFIRMVEDQREVVLAKRIFSRGTKVRVIHGTLKGVEGVLIRNAKSDSQVISVRIDHVGFASMTINPDEVEIIE